MITPEFDEVDENLGNNENSKEKSVNKIRLKFLPNYILINHSIKIFKDSI
jgi:hypothetical protein